MKDVEKSLSERHPNGRYLQMKKTSISVALIREVNLKYNPSFYRSLASLSHGPITVSLWPWAVLSISLILDSFLSTKISLQQHQILELKSSPGHTTRSSTPLTSGETLPRKWAIDPALDGLIIFPS